jgi:hypothetical protein
MLVLGLFNLLLAAAVVTGLAGVCLVPRLFRTEPHTASAAEGPEALPERLAA